MRNIFCSLAGVFLCLIFNVSSQTQDKCKLARKDCVLLNECPEATKLLEDIRKNKKSEKLAYLLSLQCGWNPSSRRPYVCCSTENSAKENSLSTPPDVSNHRNLKLFNLRKCGRSNKNGYKATALSTMFEDEDWKVLIINNNGEIRCTGSLINDRYILTAAHCVQNFTSDHSIKVRLGDHNLLTNPDCECDIRERTTCKEPSTTVGVEEIHVHPEYSEKKMTNDIALLRLDRDLKSSFQPVCLPLFNDEINDYSSSVIDVFGWGVSKFSSAKYVELAYTEIEFIKNEDCVKKYKNSREINNTQFCVEPLKKSQLCVEDDGGDISVQDRDKDNISRMVQVGIASFPTTGCSNYFPSVYTRVEYYRKWILDTVRK